MPMLIIDCHAHLYADDPARYREMGLEFPRG